MEQDGIFYDGVLLRHQCRNHAARFESVVDLRHHVAVPLHDRAKILSDAVGEKQVVLRSVFRQSANNYFTAAQNNKGCYLVTTSSLNASEWIMIKAENEGEIIQLKILKSVE